MPSIQFSKCHFVTLFLSASNLFTVYTEEQSDEVVDLAGLEPATFALQTRRSSQLSYRPNPANLAILHFKLLLV